MGFWWLAIKDTLQIGRDKKALLTLVFMPLLLIGILGAAFGNMLGEENSVVTIDNFNVGIVNLDKGELGAILEKEVFEKGLNSIVTVKSMDNKKLLSELEKQNLSVGIIIPEDFSDGLIAGKETTVQTISVPSASIQSMIIESAVQQFSQSVSVDVAGMEMLFSSPANGEGQPNTGVNPGSISFDQKSYQALEEITVEPDQKQVSSFQYYAAGMGVMFLLMTVIQGVSAMIEEKEQEVYKRLLVSNLTHSQYLFGKLLGLFLLSSIQLIVIIVGTTLLFDVYWGDSLSGIIVIGLTFVFSACGLGILLGTLARTEKSFNALGMLGVQILAAAGGSMVPLYLFPDWVNTIMKFFPNGLALQTFLNLMSGGDLKGIIFEAAMLLIIGLIFLGAALLRLSAERRKTYA